MAEPSLGLFDIIISCYFSSYTYIITQTFRFLSIWILERTTKLCLLVRDAIVSLSNFSNS
jgi:hypothetical protein